MRGALVLSVALTLLLPAARPPHAAGAGKRSAPGRSETPASLLADADKAFAALRASARAQRQRQNFARVLDAYRNVFERHPGTRQGEQALLRSGELLTLLFRWTGQEGDLNRAQNYYQRLVQSSPKSRYYDDALLAIAYLYLDHFKDPAQAWLRFRDVTQLAPDGNKTPEARRQLKRLARFAPAVTAPPASISAQLPCPTPSAAAAAAAQETPQPASTAPAIPGVPPPQPANAVLAPSPNRVRGIRHWSNPEYSRVVIDLDQKTNFYSNLLQDTGGGGKPPRLYVDLFNSVVEERFCKPISVNDGILLAIRAGQNAPDNVRVVLEIDALRTYRVFPMENPFRIVVDVTGGVPETDSATLAAASRPIPDLPEPPVAAPAAEPPGPAPGADLPVISTAPPQARFEPAPVPVLTPLPPPTIPSTPTTPPEPATTTATAPAAAPARTPPAAPPPARIPRAPTAPAPSGKPSLARQLGLGIRRVVIDAGHGAHDPGAIGVGGLQEKDVTLDLALRVRDLLRTAGYETILTRDQDVYLPLEERTAIANTARGDLFLSLHCNSSDAGNLNGVETYFLNLASNLRSMKTAARENSMAIANMSDLQQIVREIQNSKMDESSQFAAKVQRSLHDTLHRKYSDVKDLGVKQAPFYVLIGAQMPSVLAEVSFINHRTEGRRLATPAYRQVVAQAIADGVKRYAGSVKTATVPRSAGATP